jgi:hypothetical protein
MKSTVFPHTVALLILGLVSPLTAQNLESSQPPSEASLKADGSHGVQARFSSATEMPGSFEVPTTAKAEGLMTDEQAVIASQDSLTLNPSLSTQRDMESVVDLDVLRNPSHYRRVMVSTSGDPYAVATDSLQQGLAAVSAAYRESGKPEKSSDCLELSLSVEQRVKLDVSKVLEIVELEVGANPGCACEIVKTAIKASEADAQKVVTIVEAAIHASPESMRIVSQCAIAACPEAITGVQALLARLDPNAGDAGYSSKSAKSDKGEKVASITAPPIPNPLDLPPAGPPITPPPIIPPPVTDVDPGDSFF